MSKTSKYLRGGTEMPIMERLEKGLMPSQVGAMFAAPTPPPKKKWMGSVPTECQLCNQPLKDRFYDAYVPSYGQWGICCTSCAKSHGVKTGTGKGQLYGLPSLEKIAG